MIESSGAFDCWSVETSASCGSVLSFSSIFGAQVLSSSKLGSCSVYWYCPREMRPPTVMSCAGCRNSVDAFEPGDLRAQPVDDLRRASALRSSCGFSPMKKRAVLSVLPLPEPKNDPNAAMSGSFDSTVATSRCSRFISAGETSCAASMMPVISPVSCVGKKPFGISDEQHGR